MATLEQLHADKRRINAMLNDPFINYNAANELYEQLTHVCDRIDSLELTKLERSVKYFMDRNTIPF